jgi:hypothetical protein
MQRRIPLITGAVGRTWLSVARESRCSLGARWMGTTTMESKVGDWAREWSTWGGMSYGQQARVLYWQRRVLGNPASKDGSSLLLGQFLSNSCVFRPETSPTWTSLGSNIFPPSRRLIRATRFHRLPVHLIAPYLLPLAVFCFVYDISRYGYRSICTCI